MVVRVRVPPERPMSSASPRRPHMRNVPPLHLRETRDQMTRTVDAVGQENMSAGLTFAAGHGRGWARFQTEMILLMRASGPMSDISNHRLLAPRAARLEIDVYGVATEAAKRVAAVCLAVRVAMRVGDACGIGRLSARFGARQDPSALVPDVRGTAGRRSPRGSRSSPPGSSRRRVPNADDAHNPYRSHYLLTSRSGRERSEPQANRR